MAVEREGHAGDVARGSAVDRLHEVDMVGRDRAVELDANALAHRITEGRRPPRRFGIAIQRLGGPVLGRVGDPVAVRGRGHGFHADLVGCRERIRSFTGKDVQASVTGVLLEWSQTTTVGRADVVAYRCPPPGARSVLIGDDEDRVGTYRAAECRL